MKNIRKQIDKILRLGRWYRIPVIRALLHNKLKNEIMNSLIRGGALHTLKDKFYIFKDAHSLYFGLQETVYTAAAKVMLGLPQDLLFCPLCYGTYGKETPLNIKINDTEVDAIECDEHGVLCVNTPDQRFLPLMRLVLLHIPSDEKFLNYFFHIAIPPQPQSAKLALSVIRNMDDLFGGYGIAEIVGEIYDLAAMKLEGEDWWSEDEILAVLERLQLLKGFLVTYSSLLDRVMKSDAGWIPPDMTT